MTIHTGSGAALETLQVRHVDEPLRLQGGQPRQVAFRFVIALVLAWSLGSSCREPAADQPARFQRALMGTIWTIQIAESGVEPASLADKAFDEVARIEDVMSEWQADSPISAVNREAGKATVSVPRELVEILQRGILWGEETGGAFDVTWRALGRLWKFDEGFRVPTEEEISTALELVDYSAIAVSGDRVFLPRAGMAIGLGGIAKGYGVDRAAMVLREEGVENFLIEGGGDVFAEGRRFGRPWRVGIRHPRGEAGALIGVASATSSAIVTSGDYERFKIVGGVRYHHILDLRTGWPARSCQSVTVLGPSTEDSDVLATALFVLGPEEGLQMIEGRDGFEALIVDASGRLWKSSGLDRHVQLDLEPRRR